MKPAEFIADLHELKMSLVRPLNMDKDFIQPNVTYSVLETLIASFMDKYKVHYREVELVLRERAIKNS